MSKNLVAIDGSELSMKAADYAIAIAKREGDNCENRKEFRIRSGLI
ncbi:MAG: universal stress protein [Candidatus Nitrosopolaris sp.]